MEHVAAPDLTQIYAKLRGKQTTAAAGKPEPKAKEIGFTGALNRWVMIPDKQAPWFRAELDSLAYTAPRRRARRAARQRS